MPLTIRTADPAADYPVVAALCNAVSTDNTTVDDLCAYDARTGPDEVRRRFVADHDGQVVAYGYVLHADYDLPGHFWTWLTVADDARRQGIGARLYGEALAFARTCGATALHSEVSRPSRRHCASPRCAASRWKGISSSWCWRWGRSTCAPTPGCWAGPRRGASGVFAGRGRRHARPAPPVVRGQLPGRAGRSRPRADELAELRGIQRDHRRARFQPEGQILAADGDAVVGLSAVTYDASANTANQLMTAVARPYRGRGIAEALKLRAIEYALACGAANIRTRNDSANAPMLAVNHKLGFRPEPGLYRLVCTLETPR